MRARAARQALRFPRPFPTDAFYLDRKLGGLGYTSALTEYVAAVLKHFFEALNDAGRLGALARASLHECLHPDEKRGPRGDAPQPASGDAQPAASQGSSLFAMLVDDAPQPSPQQHPPVSQPADLWNAPPNKFPPGPPSPSLMGRMHQWLLNWHFLARVDTSAGPHQTAPYNLWETLNYANRIHARGLSDQKVLSMVAPLWQLGVIYLTQLLHEGGQCLQTWEQFRIAHPAAGEEARAALRGITDLICAVPGLPPNTPATLVPQHMHPVSKASTPLTGKLQHLTVLRCAGLRAGPAGDEYLVEWAYCLEMPTSVKLQLEGMGCIAAGQGPSQRADCWDVQWQASWETADTLGLQNAEYEQRVRAALFGSLQQQQPIDTKAPPPAIPVPLGSVTIDHTEVNPDVDVEPLPAPSVIVQDGAAWCYTQDGRCVAALPPSMLQDVHADFAAACVGTEPDLDAQPPPGPRSPAFITPLLKLLQEKYIRYYAELPRGHKRLGLPFIPPAVVQSLSIACSLSVQWQGCPLTRLRADIPHFTATTPTSQPFGGHYHPHGFRFSGHAGIILTPPTEEAATVTLKWAVLSAYCAQPTLTVLLVLPSIAGRAYRKYLRHPHVHHLCTVPKERRNVLQSHLLPSGAVKQVQAQQPRHATHASS